VKTSFALAAASLLFSTALLAAETGPQPPRMTPEMMKAIATTLPLEGAPKAIPGPYATASEPAFGVATLKIIRPKDLGKFPTKDTLPVVVWSNGGCAMENTKNQGFYETVASHGFLVVTTTNPPADPAAAPGARPRAATAEDLTAAINWADAENKRDGSPLKGKIETGKVAVMGQSCGGMLSVHLGGDPRVATIGVFNSGATGNDTKEQIAALHGPVLLINGGDRDPLMGLSKQTFDAINNVPAFYGSRHGAGHTATMYHPGGGEWANVASNWALWQLKGDMKAAKMFVGKKCGLCTNKNWDVEQKGLK
jgi:hypothetical protein